MWRLDVEFYTRQRFLESDEHLETQKPQSNVRRKVFPTEAGQKITVTP